MKLTFLGTRGGILSRSARHKNHSVLLIDYYTTRLMIDCGADWLSKVSAIHPTAILLTHAHPDHAGGLQGSSVPVCAPPHTHDKLMRKLQEHHPCFSTGERTGPLELRKIYRFGPIYVKAIPVQHSLIAPAVGYKITAGKKTIFYVPDVAAISDYAMVLSDVDVYIGDGAVISRKLLLRRKKGGLTGHAPISMQAEWCKEAGVRQMIITHCGTEIVTGEEDKIKEKLQAVSDESGVDIILAFDGMKILT